jgi:hypothetical protein
MRSKPSPLPCRVIATASAHATGGSARAGREGRMDGEFALENGKTSERGRSRTRVT